MIIRTDLIETNEKVKCAASHWKNVVLYYYSTNSRFLCKKKTTYCIILEQLAIIRKENAR